MMVANNQRLGSTEGVPNATAMTEASRSRNRQMSVMGMPSTTKLIARIASLGKRAGPASGPNLFNIVFATSAALWIAARNEDVCSWFTRWLASKDQNKTRHRRATRILPCGDKAHGSSESTCGHPWRD